MLKKKNANRLFLGSLLAITFVYGLAVGHYRIFPFNAIYEAKNIVMGHTTTRTFKEPGYTHKTSFFQLISQNDYDIVFIGDSITDGSDWYDIFPNKIIANRGISGDTTEGILKRMDTILNTNAEKAFVMIGTNDISRGTDIKTIFNNYVKILEQLKINNIEPIVQSTLFTYDNAQRDNKVISRLNKKLKDFCSEKNIIYVDLNVHLSKNERLINEYSNDGLHLNGQGYVIWAKAIKEYVY